MKIYRLVLALGLLVLVEAQRRATKPDTPSDPDVSTRPLRRGRTRFIAPADATSEDPKPVDSPRKLPSRRKPEGVQPPSKKNYEVKEVLDDTPQIEHYRKPTKTRVLTENNFEVRNAPPTQLFQPITTENVEEILKSIANGNQEAPLAAPEVATAVPAPPSETAPGEVSKVDDITKTQEVTTPLTTKAAKRAGVRGRINGGTPAPPTIASRGRVRTRPIGNTPEATTAPSRNSPRNFRKRPENAGPVPVESRTRVPSVIAAAETGALPTRSRTGRKITPTRRNDDVRTIQRSEAPEKLTINLPARRTSTRQGTETSTVRARSRSREEAPVVVPPAARQEPRAKSRAFLGRARSTINSEAIETSATENDVNVKIVRAPKNSLLESRTEAGFKRRTSKPIVKETVISQVSEVTSKRFVTRKRPNKPEPKPASRGAQKADPRKGTSEEDVEESDNYPPQFKALLQAKKFKKESRSQPLPFTKPEKVVTSPSRPVSTSEATRQVHDSENELEQTPTPLRRATAKPKAAVAVSSKTRFHAKFNNEPEPSPKPRSFVPKTSRGIPSRKPKSTSTKAPQNPVQTKSSRYSSRYRKEASTRSGIRTSTNAPAYLPTIPSIVRPTSVVPSSAFEDKDLGLEVISFDDPVNTLASANLVKGELLSPPSDKPLKPLASGSQTKSADKQPVSIIERIINSITAISTTESPDASKPTLPPNDLSTRPTAILKLTTKKSTKLDKTSTTQTVPTTMTSENPTTIIERILSSLSAIQADNSSAKVFYSKQVGTNYNTISSPSTTPITRVTKSTLPAHYSTTLNPLVVLDEISNETVLQKRTIGKLLDLLNSLKGTERNLVVVTPKTTSFVSTSEASDASTSPQLYTSPVPPTQLTQTTAVRYTTTPTTTESTIRTFSTETTPEPAFIFPSTIPNLLSFEVSPESVAVFSANDLSISNAIPLGDMSSVTPNTESSTSTDSSSVAFESRFGFSTTTELELKTSTTEANLELKSSTTEANLELKTSTIEANASVTTEAALLGTSELTGLISTTSGTDIETTIMPEDVGTTILATSTEAVTNNPDIVPNLIDTNSLNETSISSRSGRLLDIVQGPVRNQIDASTDKDYFIFAVLNNNTILRKRPSRFPNKETPFLIVGVYPNNTIVRKFPNGTLVPMEPILRVSGFDTRENPPPLPEITSNQVTPDQGRRPDNNLQMVEQNTISSVEANPLSISSDNSANLVSNSTSTSSKTTTSTTPLPQLTEILNGKTLKAFNSIINISDLTKSPGDSTKTTAPPTTAASLVTIASRNAGETTTVILPTTTEAVTTSTFVPPTTTMESTTVTARPRAKFTTVLPLSQPVTTTYKSTTSFPSTTFLPTFLTTLFSNTILPRFRSTTPIPTTLSPKVEIWSRGEELAAASTTKRSVTTMVPTTFSTQLPMTTVGTTTPQPIRSKTIAPSTTPSANSITPSIEELTKNKKLSAQQSKDLETLAQLEMEQAQILKQLAFLTNLNLGTLTKNAPETTTAGTTATPVSTTAVPTTTMSELANRIIALAIERDESKTRQAKEISPGNENVEDLLKKINNEASPTAISEYGHGNDAILASLLKEQGIGPTTPKGLGNIYKQTTTTRRPRTTTARRGPLMQSLNWLLNVLAPPTTKKPRGKTVKPKIPVEEDIFSHQPTHITPVVTAAPGVTPMGTLSQQDIGNLIKQLETIQKDPQGKSLDFSSINSLQTLLKSGEGVQITSSGTRGSVPVTTPVTPRAARSRVVKATTALPPVSNSIFEDPEPVTTVKPRVTLAPVKLRPVHGVDDGDGSMVRGQLITAAVNVTRAISSFLGTALQDAAHQFTRLFAHSSGNAQNIFSSSFLANVSTRDM